MAALASAGTCSAVIYLLFSKRDFISRLSIATAYGAIALTALALLLGPWNVIRSQPNPVSFDLRRDMGIGAGIFAVLHSALGLNVHLRGRMWLYFVDEHGRWRTDIFGLSNYTGVIAALLFLFLLAISNDASLRHLGLRKWKSSQRFSYLWASTHFCAEWRPDNSCARPSQATVEQLREPLKRYRVGRNVPAITEINSGSTSVTSRLAYIAVGEFGAPIYAPWALTVSYPEAYEPYILADGSAANGAFALRETYESLSKALPQISYYAATDKLKVFMADSPGQQFTQTESVNGFQVTVSGERDGKAIVIHLSNHNFLVIGYRASISWKDAGIEWPHMKRIHVERVRWSVDHWIHDGEPEYGVDQSHQSLELALEIPQAVLVNW